MGQGPPFERNIPVILGLLAICYNDFVGPQTVALLPYDQYLQRFPAYLHRLTMEGDGKHVTLDGAENRSDTGPVYWGELGPATFRLSIDPSRDPPHPVRLHCVRSAAQPSRPAPPTGSWRTYSHRPKRSHPIQLKEEVKAEGTPDSLVPHRSSKEQSFETILASRLTPETLGKLVALHEHSLFTQGPSGMSTRLTRGCGTRPSQTASFRNQEVDVDPFDFVRSHAQWRAQHRVPLVASLHAYRLAHRTYSGITKEQLLGYPRRDDALLALAMFPDFWIEFFDYVGSVLMHAHAVEGGQTIARNTQAYHRLIENLLRGLEPDNPEEQGLRVMCGIRPGLPLAVAVGWLIPSARRQQFDAEAALRSLVRLIRQELPSASFGKLVALKTTQ